MLLRNSGIRDIETVLKVSRRCVLNHLLKQAALCVIKPFQQRYKSVQIDEHWSYVGHKKDKKRWLFMPTHQKQMRYWVMLSEIEVQKRLKNCIKRMPIKIEIEEYCTDNWSAFSKVFSGENHKVGKGYACAIEGVNNSLRARNRRLVRKTTCASKKDEYHEAAIKIMFYQRNYRYHTF